MGNNILGKKVQGKSMDLYEIVIPRIMTEVISYSLTRVSS